MTRSLRWILAFGLLGAACAKPPPDPRVETAALADLTTRQLIAGLNAGNLALLSGLLAITSTTGGPPRPLTASELAELVYPEGPFEYLGAGRPGTMVLLDGHKTRQVVRLVRLGGELKVLASSASLRPGSGIGLAAESRVITLFRDDPREGSASVE